MMTLPMNEKNSLSDKKVKKPLTRNQKILITVVVMAVAALIAFIFPEGASAYTEPNANAPGYPFYDLVVDKGLKGPIGFAIGVWLLILAGTSIGANPKMAALQGLGGGALIKADSIAESLGWMI